MKTVFCLAEDRAGAEIGLKLAVLSLVEHCPGSRVVIFRPSSAPSFAPWLAQFPSVELVTQPLAGANNWNCKPHALLHLWPEVEADAATQLVWLDSDLLVTRDIRDLVAAGGPDAVAITQEPVNQANRGTGLRTRGWGLPVGTEYPDTFNSCVVRVTRHHGELLRRWRQLLDDPRYTSVASLPITAKPPWFWGDQDVLNALLGAAEFQSIPVHLLRHGRDILHTGGALAFTLPERWRGLGLPVPAVLHAIGVKPWVQLRPGPKEAGSFAALRRLCQETSPFVARARRYRSRVAESTAWLAYRSFAGTLLKLAGLGHWAWTGVPLLLTALAWQRFRRP
jgi:hypothetical protein